MDDDGRKFVLDGIIWVYVFVFSINQVAFFQIDIVVFSPSSMLMRLKFLSARVKSMAIDHLIELC